MSKNLYQIMGSNTHIKLYQLNLNDMNVMSIVMQNLILIIVYNNIVSNINK